MSLIYIFYWHSLIRFYFLTRGKEYILYVENFFDFFSPSFSLILIERKVVLRESDTTIHG